MIANKKNYLWLGILIIWISHFVMDFMIGVWPIYKTLVHLDLVIAGLIASFGMLIGEGSQLYFGRLSDRGWHQFLIVLGLSLTAAIPFLSYIENRWILFLFVLSAFIGSGAFHPAATSLLANSTSTSRSFLIALFACGGMMGAAFSQTGFAYVHTQLEGNTWVLVIPIILLTICCALFKFPKIEVKTSQITFSQVLKAIKPRRAEILLLYTIHVCLQVVVLSFSFLLPDVLKMKGYTEWLCLGGGYCYFIIGSAVVSLPIGYCVDKFGYRPILKSIIVGSIGLIYMFLTLKSLSFVPMMVILLLLGGTLGVIIPVVVAGGVSLVPSYAQGLIAAFYMGGTTCLAGFGPTLASVLCSYFTDDAPVNALKILSSLLVVALGLAYFLPQPIEERLEIKEEQGIS